MIWGYHYFWKHSYRSQSRFFITFLYPAPAPRDLQFPQKSADWWFSLSLSWVSSCVHSGKGDFRIVRWCKCANENGGNVLCLAMLNSSNPSLLELVGKTVELMQQLIALCESPRLENLWLLYWSAAVSCPYWLGPGPLVADKYLEMVSLDSLLLNHITIPHKYKS